VLLQSGEYELMFKQGVLCCKFWVHHRPLNFMCYGTRTVQVDSGSDTDSESQRKECPLFNSAGAYSGGRFQRVSPDSWSQAVYQNDFLILVSYSVVQWHAK